MSSQPPQPTQRRPASALLEPNPETDRQQVGRQTIVSTRTEDPPEVIAAQIVRDDATHASELRKDNIMFYLGVAFFVAMIGLSTWLILRGSTTTLQSFGGNLLIAIVGGVAGYMWNRKSSK